MIINIVVGIATGIIVRFARVLVPCYRRSYSSLTAGVPAFQIPFSLIYNRSCAALGSRTCILIHFAPRVSLARLSGGSASFAVCCTGCSATAPSVLSRARGRQLA
jgi:hypothetical protein